MKMRVRQIVSIAISALISFMLFGSAPSEGQETTQKIDAATANQVLPYALMSQDTYNDTATLKIPGWTRIDDWEGIFGNPKSGLADFINQGRSIGFYAAIYKNDTTGEISVAYRGSKNLLKDYVNTNIPASVGHIPRQYVYADMLATAVKLVYPETPSFTLTGHSKGGGEATYAAQQQKTAGIANVITFNPASPGILSSATRGWSKQVNVIVPDDRVGNPKPGSIIGLGHLPGKLYKVDSTTAYRSDPFAQTQGPPVSRNKRYYDTVLGTHNLSGVIGGLCSSSPSSCLSLQTKGVGQLVQPSATDSKPAPTPSVDVSPQPSQAPTTATAVPVGSPTTVGRPVNVGSPAPAGTAKEIGNPAPVGQSIAVGQPVTTGTPVTVGTASAPSTPGGISLSKAAASRMPLNIGLDGAYFKDGQLILSGRYDPEQRLDAALLLTAVRLACEADDPLFSLDPPMGAGWLNEGKNATGALWARIKDNFKSRPAANATRQTKPVLEFRTVSARRDYPTLWASLAPSYPNLKSTLVFKPEWLRETRFGEVLYKGDLLLKELSYGVPILQEGELRASKIDRYVTVAYRDAAKGLLSQLAGAPSSTEWRGSRLWFDLTPERVSPTPANSIPAPMRPYKLEPIPEYIPYTPQIIEKYVPPPLPEIAVAAPPKRGKWKSGARHSPQQRRQVEEQWKRDAKINQEQWQREVQQQWREIQARHGLTPPSTVALPPVSTVAGGITKLNELLRARNLIGDISAGQATALAVRQDGNTLDLSQVYPRMFVRRHDQTTGQDIPGSEPSLDGLAADVNQRIDRYVNAYAELGILADLFRAYVVAVHAVKDASPLCARIRALPLLDGERAITPLPKEHPSEVFITVGSYEFNDGNLRRLVSVSGHAINGGVSISGRSLYATAVKTLITQMMNQALNQRPTDRAEWEVSDRRFVAFNIESDLPVVVSRPSQQSDWPSTVPNQQPGIRIEQDEIPGSSSIPILLIAVGLFWYVATKARKAVAPKNENVTTPKNIPSVGDNSGHHTTGGKKTLGLSTRLPDDPRKRIGCLYSQIAVDNIEIEFRSVFSNLTDNDRDRLVTRWIRRQKCSRSEALRWAIAEHLAACETGHRELGVDYESKRVATDKTAHSASFAGDFESQYLMRHLDSFHRRDEKLTKAKSKL